MLHCDGPLVKVLSVTNEKSLGLDKATQQASKNSPSASSSHKLFHLLINSRNFLSSDLTEKKDEGDFTILLYKMISSSSLNYCSQMVMYSVHPVQHGEI